VKGCGRTAAGVRSGSAAIRLCVMCLGNAFTCGYLTLAAVLCSSSVCEGIHADGQWVLMHGPTFMANPLACAVARASINLLLESPWQQRVSSIERQLNESLTGCRALPSVADVRIKGAIGVIEMKEAVDIEAVQKNLIEQGVWLRPFGILIYTMPPFVISPAQLNSICTAMKDVCSRV